MMLRRTTVLLIAGFLIGITGCSTAQVDVSKLHVPPGFHVSIFADSEASPRMLAFSPGGVLLTTAMDEGKVLAFPDPQHTGKAARNVTVLQGLNEPHGIAFHNGKLYIAAVDGVYRYDWDEANLRATDPQRIVDLSGTGGGHSTKTLIFWSGKMYVSSGSTCNVCVEKDPRRAVVMQFNEDGSGMKVFARGLRNAVGMAISPATNTIWVTDNGRDWLGNDLPPDEIYDLGQSGGDFGWPWCYGDRVPDLKFSKDSPQRCSDVVVPKVNLQAHSAPLGLAFYDSDKFPPEYRGDLFVAFHGSWNRSVPTGYKVVRIHFAEGRKPQVEDFVTGWMKPNASRASRPLGRPVGVVVGPDGALYISDDTSGAIYRVTYSR